jgi:hypothetical protein
MLVCAFATVAAFARAEPRVLPVPGDVESTVVVEGHIAAVVPFVDALCPSGSGCLLNEGFGIGAWVERRWPFGGALYLGYDVAFLTAQGVYEVGVLQALRTGGRWVFPTGQRLRPYAELGIDVVCFGDSFQIATAGAAVDLGAGGELELSSSTSLVFGLVFRAFTTGPFVTPNDRVVRGDDPAASLALLARVGIAWFL